MCALERKKRDEESRGWVPLLCRVFGEGFVDKIPFRPHSKGSEEVSREAIWEDFRLPVGLLRP